MAGDEVGVVDLVGGLDGPFAKAQVGNGEAAGLLGVVGEVGLHVHIGVIADDLDGVLVGAHGAVRAQAVELAGDGALGRGVVLLAQFQRAVGHIVHDAHGEVVLGLGLLHVVEDGLDHGGGEFLAGKAVAAAVDGDVVPARFDQRRAHIDIQRVAQGAGLLGAVHHGQALDAPGQGGQQAVRREGAVEVNLEHAVFLAVLVEGGDRFVYGLGAGAHDDDHVLGIRGALVAEQLVAAAGEALNLLHALFHDAGHRLVVLVGGFAVLEEDVGVLGGAGLAGPLGVEGAGAEGGHFVPVHQLLDVFVVDLVDLLQLVAGAEAVKEVEEGHRGLDGGQVRHQGHVLRLLHGAGSEHRKAGLAAGHHVGVVAEDGQRVGGQGAG